MEKIQARETLIALSEKYRSEGKKIGYTSGVFDILHRGHVEYLSEARKECDVLIVGVNSDSSVRENKGPSRPIQQEEDRLAVIASLGSVSHAFLFSEKNNNQNIKLLKPDLYLKAGDYDKSKLSSAPIVESYGGSIKLIPFLEGRSSTSVIEKIQNEAITGLAHYETYPPPEKAPAAFLDRDGTICKHVEYLSDPKQFELLPGVVEGLKELQAQGFRLVVVTNQPGIGFGYFPKEDFFKVNKEMLKQLSQHDILIDKIYFSPYTKAEKKPCRKPGTLLGERAVEELNLDLEHSIMFGDAQSDVEFAKNLGCFSCFLSEDTSPVGTGPHYVTKSLLDGVKLFLAERKSA